MPGATLEAVSEATVYQLRDYMRLNEEEIMHVPTGRVLPSKPCPWRELQARLLGFRIEGVKKP